MESKPMRPYKSLAEYRIKVAFPFSDQFFKDNPDKWPCLECGAKGWEYDPDDPRCPVEGNKCRNRLKCCACKGTRCGDRWRVAAAYRERIARYRIELAEWIRCESLKRSGLGKLTSDERKALGV